MTQENSHKASAAATSLNDFVEKRLAKILGECAGQEQQALIDLVRSADLHAYFQKCFSLEELTVEFFRQCVFIVKGIGPVLRTFLPKLDAFPDGIPWVPSRKENASWADHVLIESGRLEMLRRLAYCERYGLVECQHHTDKHISIHLLASDIESLDVKDGVWVINKTLAGRAAQQEHIDLQVRGWARNRIDEYVRIHREHFIEYDSDWELLELYEQYVERDMIKSAEADAFPDDVVLGPRTFGEWKAIAANAAARASLHLSFATRLRFLNQKKLDLRNLLTIYVRHEDLREVWRQQTGVSNETELDEIADIFLLTEKHAEEYFTNHDQPLPYNIRFGKYFSLLPQFGYLINTCTFLVTELRRKYRKDWDKAVNLREAKFQQDLYAILPEGNYVRGRENATIRRGVGETETDIDAVIFEKSSNSLYLFQLKWFDVFALNLRERQSKLTNLLKANKWVDQVSQWLATTERRELLSRLGLQKSGIVEGSLDIRLMVLTRFSARFSGTHQYDNRAAWLSWPRLCRLMNENNADTSPLAATWRTARKDETTSDQEEKLHVEYVFPDFKVDVYE